MTTYTVSGGASLSGKVELRGAKNAGFKAMIAALLASSPSTISNLGLISEINFARQVITSLGGKVLDTADPHELIIDPSQLSQFAIPAQFGAVSRSSMMYVGPLLAKFQQALIPVPGGDIAIGKRPVDRHLAGLQALGVKVNFNDQTSSYELTAAKGLVGCNYKFAKITHTGTETLIMAAVLAKGHTTLENCAQDPEIDNLIEFLVKMGAKVNRTLPTTIEIDGVDNLIGSHHTILPDRIEAATFACMALGTKGKVEVVGANSHILHSLLYKIEEIGGKFTVADKSITFWYDGLLKAASLTTAPYPGFLTDWQPLWTTLMTQAQGDSLVHETVHDNRFGFVKNLLAMGAKIDLFNPPVTNPDFIYQFNFEDDKPGSMHAAVVHGPTPLSGTSLEINEIRGGATALLSGMIASGQTVISDPQDQIKRGYEDLASRLSTLGATIDVQD